MLLLLHTCICTYGTTQMQVERVAQVRVLKVEYLMANTRVELASARHEHNTMAHVTCSNQRVETCRNIFKCLTFLSSVPEKSQLALAISAFLMSINLFLSSTIYDL